jgi:hypothetical protein
LAVSGTISSLSGTYPILSTPDINSHGHIGLHCAALSVVLLVAGLSRSAGLLGGLMPAIHASMAVPAWACGGLVFVKKLLPEVPKQRQVLAAFSAGAAVCVLLAVVLLTHAKPPAAQPPYTEQANAAVVYRNFTSFEDLHRQPFPLRSVPYLVQPVAFFAVGLLLLLLWDPKRQHAVSADSWKRQMVLPIIVLGSLAWILVYSARILESVLGALPLTLNVLMPYRFSNLSALLLLPLTVVAIAETQALMADKERVLAVAQLTGLLLLAGAYAWFDRAHAMACLLISTWALLFAQDLHCHRNSKRRSLFTLSVVLLLAALLAISSHPYRPIVFVVGFLASAALFRAWVRFFPAHWNWDRWKMPMAASLFGACTLISVGVLAKPRLEPGNINLRSQAAAESGLRDWLAKHTGPDDLILSSLDENGLQARSAHPILMDQETVWLMTYMPRLAGTIGTMARDLYGIDYSRAEQLQANVAGVPSPESSVWRTRTLEQWRELGAKYHFHLILASPQIRLDLPTALSTPFWTLYAIPDAGGPQRDTAASANAETGPAGRDGRAPSDSDARSSFVTGNVLRRRRTGRGTGRSAAVPASGLSP